MTNPGTVRVTLTLAAVLAAAFLAVIAVLVFQGRGREATVGSAGDPVVFLLSPGHGEAVGEAERRALAGLLERESGLSCEVVTAASSIEAVAAFGGRGAGTQRADLGLLNVFEYLLARHEFDAQAHLRVLRAGNAESYRGELVVMAEGGPTSLSELSGRTVAFVDPHSTSGFVFPARLFAEAGVRVSVEFAGSHQRALQRVKEGGASAATIFAGASAGDGALRVIATTAEVPNEPVAFRAGLDPEKRERLAKALVRIAGSGEGGALLRSISGIEGFRPAADGEYALVLETIRATGATIQQLVPDSHRLASERRGIDLVP